VGRLDQHVGQRIAGCGPAVITAAGTAREVVREVERLARQERRTKSELFREMVRVYRRYRKQRDRDEDRWIMGVIQEAEAEQARNP